MALPRAAFAAAVCLASLAAEAHFVLDAPASSWSQDAYGDPEKAPPCGADGSGKATGLVTALHPGDTVTISITEAIFHPGHYRVALGLTGPQDLPAEPAITPKTTCVDAAIEATPSFPVLADGQLLHTSPFDGGQAFQVKLPANVTCAKCTLQVIEFMSAHPLNVPGGCFYHHCADISILPDDGGAPHDAGSPDAGAPADGGGAAGDGGAQRDGGILDGGTGGGSGCATGGPALAPLALAAWLLLWRGRREASSRSGMT
jgi:hypothetical protein